MKLSETKIAKLNKSGKYHDGWWTAWRSRQPDAFARYEELKAASQKEKASPVKARLSRAG